MLTLRLNNLPESARRQYASQSEMRPHPDVGYQAAGTTLGVGARLLERRLIWSSCGTCSDPVGPRASASEHLSLLCYLRLIRGTNIALSISPENQERGG
jgi:hypothetical protein